MKKIIGVVLRPGISELGYSNQFIYDSIISAVEQANGLVIGIPIYDELEKTYSLIDMCDGIILQGGDDPTEKDITIVKYLYDNDIPTLGICLGMQTMGIALGGKLIDLEHDNHLKKDINYVHEIIIDPQSLLYEIIGENNIRVNSRHKSHLKGTSLHVSAVSDDNIIEAIEDYTKTFFIGVEWHPESMIDYDPYAAKLFTALIKYSGRVKDDNN